MAGVLFHHIENGLKKYFCPLLESEQLHREQISCKTAINLTLQTRNFSSFLRHSMQFAFLALASFCRDRICISKAISFRFPMEKLKVKSNGKCNDYIMHSREALTYRSIIISINNSLLEASQASKPPAGEMKLN